MRLSESFSCLIKTVSSLPGVQSIGKSGGPELPESLESDIDLFVYCTEIPELSERNRAIEDIGLMNANALQGGHWGVVDLVLLSGVETYLMYFTLGETVDNVREILDGEYPDKLDNCYFPTGRLATLRDMTVLFDTSAFLYSMKRRLETYPDKLGHILCDYHVKQLADSEDLERAAARRDVLFYHCALDLALEHFLQALFAMNKVFFPSRKRSFEYLQGFHIKPEHCKERLQDIVRLGGDADGLVVSYTMWLELARELAGLRGHNQ